MAGGASDHQDDKIATGETAAGQSIVITASAWGHITAEHPEMCGYGHAILETAINPEIALDDPRPGRRRHYRFQTGPSRWLRVIVDFNQEPAQIVTAHAHRKEPPQ
jgi:hypothetical protein